MKQTNVKISKIIDNINAISSSRIEILTTDNVISIYRINKNKDDVTEIQLLTTVRTFKEVLSIVTALYNFIKGDLCK